MAQRPNPTLACRRIGVLRAGGPLALALLLSAQPGLAAPTTKGNAKDLLPATPAQPTPRQGASNNGPAELHRLTAQLNALGAVS